MLRNKWAKLSCRALIVRVTQAIHKKKPLPRIWKFLYPFIFKESVAEVQRFINDFDIALLYRVLSDADIQDITEDNLTQVRRLLLQYVFEEAYKQCSGIEKTICATISLF